MSNQPSGFTYTATKSGVVTIHHNNLLASTLKDSAAEKFLYFAASASNDELQMRMAKLTGNYKRGNERMGRQPKR